MIRTVKVGISTQQRLQQFASTTLLVPARSTTLARHQMQTPLYSSEIIMELYKLIPITIARNELCAGWLGSSDSTSPKSACTSPACFCRTDHRLRRLVVSSPRRLIFRYSFCTFASSPLDSACDWSPDWQRMQKERMHTKTAPSTEITASIEVIGERLHMSDTNFVGLPPLLNNASRIASYSAP
jgi:hypothetical protein